MNREECIKKVNDLFNQKQANIVARKLEHINEIHEKFPEISELEDELATTAAEFFRRMSEGSLDDAEFEVLKNKNLEFQEKRKKILTDNGYPENYIDDQYECELCEDEGYIGTEMCKCFKKALAEEYLKCSNLQNIYKNKTFRNFDLTFYPEGENRERMGTILEYCKKYVRTFDSKCRHLMFFGAPGCGKTFLSCAIGTELIKSGHFVLYTPVQSMIDDFEKVRFGKGYADTEIYRDCDLLIIDDLGSEFHTPLSENVIYNVINDRMNMHKAILINTNYSADEIAENYHERTVSRMLYECAKFPFVPVDVRREKERRLKDKKNG